MKNARFVGRFSYEQLQIQLAKICRNSLDHSNAMTSALPQPTRTEKVAGSVLTESALTVVGALSGGPLAPLLPVLAKYLASERQKKRVEAALSEIASVLEAHDQALQELTDAQYKLVNEVVLAVLHTTSERKLSYLRSFVRNGLAMTSLEHSESIMLSRTIRDISADEVDFLVKNFSHQRVRLWHSSDTPEPDVLVLAEGGHNELMVSGLISLGLLIPASPMVRDIGTFRFSTNAGKVIALLDARSK